MSALAPPLTLAGRLNTRLGSPVRRRFTARELSPLLNIALMLLVVVSFGSGWIASLLGLTEFGLHKYSSIGMMLVIVSHVALHWRSLAFGLRRIVGAPRRR